MSLGKRKEPIMCECYVKVAEAFPSSMRGSMCKLEKMNLVCSGNSSVELKGKFRQRPNCLYLVRLQTVLCILASNWKVYLLFLKQEETLDSHMFE